MNTVNRKMVKPAQSLLNRFISFYRAWAIFKQPCHIHHLPIS
ncbi:hypothetical protein GMES_0942 [Paraglaciecola mesophila KMM 241]|uniref:Uncharacterized protein n=1 Tax=Paraglaciecola mesophila KMM 241 TaxID=1128912 RepID=K6YGY8_9ALTE|nr:hypothetical protein GMES_0942 [Paraglaciecola mesophila KMM 241]